jgi:hypothetical protein
VAGKAQPHRLCAAGRRGSCDAIATMSDPTTIAGTLILISSPLETIANG